MKKLFSINVLYTLYICKNKNETEFQAGCSYFVLKVLEFRRLEIEQ